MGIYFSGDKDMSSAGAKLANRIVSIAAPFFSIANATKFVPEIRGLALPPFAEHDPVRGDPHHVWRADQRSMEILLQENGMKPRGESHYLEEHITGRPGVYISTAGHYTGALSFSPLVGNLYLINQPEIKIPSAACYAYQSVGKGLRSFDGEIQNFKTEAEIAAVGAIPMSDILASRKVLTLPGIAIPYMFIGSLSVNLDYERRLHSVNILSVDPKEAKEIENILKHNGKLVEGQRYLTLEEAKELCEKIRKENEELDPEHFYPHFEIGAVPANLSSNQVIEQYLNNYRAAINLFRMNSEKIIDSSYLLIKEAEKPENKPENKTEDMKEEEKKIELYVKEIEKTNGNQSLQEGSKRVDPITMSKFSTEKHVDESSPASKPKPKT